MSVAFIFPGQGEQSKDMGIPVFDNFPETQRILDLVREVSGFDVYGISQEGDESILTDPEVSSVLVFSVSMAIQEVLAQRGIKPTAVAGYSVGQFSAMACAEVSDLTSMIQLVQERGKLLKKYAAASQSGMVGVIGLTAEKLEAALAGFDQAMIANYSTKTNLSVSCKREDIAGLMQAIEALEPIKVVELPVQGGWHSNFMKQAASDFLDVLEQHEFDQPKYDLYDNLTGSKLTDTDTIRQNLSQHLYEPVLWYPSINNMIQDGITTFVEVGHGLQLTKFTMLTNRRVKVFFNFRFTSIEQSTRGTTRLRNGGDTIISLVLPQLPAIDRQKNRIRMAENVEAEVKEFISKNFIFEQELTPELSLTESGILDSMGVVSLVGHIETVFQIEVDDEDINQSNFGSVQKIVNYIESRLNG